MKFFGLCFFLSNELLLALINIFLLFVYCSHTALGISYDISIAFFHRTEFLPFEKYF